jgi:hypothetical protein
MKKHALLLMLTLLAVGLLFTTNGCKKDDDSATAQCPRRSTRMDRWRHLAHAGAGDMFAHDQTGNPSPG